MSDSSNIHEGDGFGMVMFGKMGVRVFHLVIFEFHCVGGEKERKRYWGFKQPGRRPGLEVCQAHWKFSGWWHLAKRKYRF